jgi:hypothetical protein
MTSEGFRHYLPPDDDPRITDLRGLGTYEYAEYAKYDSFTGPLITGWAKLYPEPFTGVTADGRIIDGLFDLEDPGEARRAPTSAMTAAARRLIESLSQEDQAKLTFPLAAHEWRAWANPEFMQHNPGLRLDELAEDLRDRCLSVVEASLSEHGFDLVRTLMKINAFMGDLVDLPVILGEYSYNFSIFGPPDENEPWGWSLFGHHIAINCLVVGGQMVMSPVFLGAEPSYVDEGPLKGTRVFDDRIAAAHRLVAELTDEQRAEARIFEQMVDPAMPEDRIHAGDERHLAGAFQDNRVIPYEGTGVREMSAKARGHLETIVDQFLALLPPGPAAARRAEIVGQFDESWFCWIGGFDADDPFYFRIQSAVVILELDHHCGVFLTNDEPMPFHIHTVMRTPNGNDYGRVLVAQHLGPDAPLPGD